MGSSLSDSDNMIAKFIYNLNAADQQNSQAVSLVMKWGPLALLALKHIHSKADPD